MESASPSSVPEGPVSQPTPRLSPRPVAPSSPDIAPHGTSNDLLQPIPSARASQSSRDRSGHRSSLSVNTITTRRFLPRPLHRWESPLLIIGFFVLGLVCSISHCVFYASLDGTIVPDGGQQENNLRVGTAMAFLAQITFTASVWQTYDQQIWRHLDKPLSMVTLNDIFGAQSSLLSYLNVDFLKRFPLGYFMGLFAWSLILPPFFTPGTLSVYESTNEVVSTRLVPYPGIAHSTNGHFFSFSPSYEGDRFNFRDVQTRVFSGPRSILALLTTATASQAGILSLPRPANHSSYTISFFGPSVQCTEANATTKGWIDQAVAAEMERSVTETTRQVETAYHAYVPAAAPDHNAAGQADVRFQSPANATNELWMRFERYKNSTDRICDRDKHHYVCSLWNSTYQLTLNWENNFQNVSGSSTPLHMVAYPPVDPANTTTEMTQHAYSAFFWALADQLVGSFGRYAERLPNGSERYFPLIRSPIQHNSLLGSSDLNVFFDYNEENDACERPYESLSAQRQQDIDRSRGRKLPELVEELAFNSTISLIHNDLLTNKTERPVTEWQDVNRYGYNPYGLWIPYALASLFTFLTVIIGTIAFFSDGAEPKPGHKFQDIVGAVERREILILADLQPRAEGT